MILIYVPEINERISYTFSFIFKHILGVAHQLTDSPDFFSQENKPKFSYSLSCIENEIHFPAHSLLFEDIIKKQDLTQILKDPFATTFFLLSRYEEYLPFQADFHNRFSFSASSIKGKIDPISPWIDIFAYDLFHKLKKRFPTLKTNDRKFNFINTLDIDHAWLYKNKNWIRNSGSLLKKILKFKWRDFRNQAMILSGLKTDPYYIYPYIQSLEIPTFYFISFGKGSKWDTNHSPENINYQNLICELSKNSLNTIGLHPSYHSNDTIQLLRKEQLDLENLLNKKVIYSRQHFIKIKLPETYDNLINVNINSDFSMGYQDHVGFRAGTCTPFYWFDLIKNKLTSLKVYPFCLMDVTLKNYMKLSIDEAENIISDMVQSVKKVNGTFISIFHNDSLSDHGEWKNWRSLYEKLILKVNDQ